MKPRARLLAGIAVAVLSTAVVWSDGAQPPHRDYARATRDGVADVTPDMVASAPEADRAAPSPPTGKTAADESAAGESASAAAAPATRSSAATSSGPAAGATTSAAAAIAGIDPSDDAADDAPDAGAELAYAEPGQIGSRDARPADTPSVARPDLATITVEAETVARIIEHYRKGEIGEGDALAADLSGAAARTLVEWTAIRHNGAPIGFRRLSAFLVDHGDWPQSDIVQRYAEKAMWRQKIAPVEVFAFFLKRKPEGADGKFAMAVALQSIGKSKEAEALVADAWRGDPVDRDLERAIRDDFPAVLTDANNRARLERLAFRKDWVVAQRLAAEIGPRETRLLKARMAVDRGASLKSGLAGLSVADRGDPLIQFAEARELRRQGKREEAAAVMLKAPAKPEVVVEGDQWAQERQRLARGLLEAGKLETAYDVIKPNVAVSETDNIETEMLAGWIALRFLNKPEVAAQHFARAEPHADLPTSLARVAYWRGRAAEAGKDAAQAAAFFEAASKHTTTYYGQLARAKLGKKDLPVSPAAPGDVLARAALEKSEIVQAIRLLYHLDERRTAILLLDELARNVQGVETMAAVAHIAASLSDTRAELVVGKRALYRGFPLERAAFPTTGIPAFEQAGDSVERSMTFAIARQESAFAADAVSSAGARGLMQLMPATAKATAQRAGLPYDVDRLTSDPAYNAALGTAHLGELVDYWRGSYILTFAAYNAGPGNVRKWLAAYGDPRRGDVDTVDWVERIPFPETRNYVQRVMENLQVYRHILSDRTALLIERDLRRGALQ